MDLLRRLASEAPKIQDARDNKPTLLLSWWCTCFAITVILFRLSGRYVRTEKLFREDGVMLLAIIPLLARMGLVHVILLFGTNNTTTLGLTEVDIQQRELGSKLVLAARIMYAAYLWTTKYSVSLFLRSMTENIWKRSHQRMLRSLHAILGLTFLAVVVSDLAECHPFTHYWQVVPDPGPQCRQGYAQFLTLTLSNIVTNLALVSLPMPMILKSQLPRNQKISIIVRMALPILGIAVTIYQITSVLQRHGDQQFRSLLASTDILSTTFISNAVVLGSLLQDRGYKKTKKYKHVFENGGIAAKKAGDRSTSTTYKDRWGSDEDLMLCSSEADAKEARGNAVELKPIEGLPRRAEPVRFAEIRVNSTWEIAVDERS